MLEDATHGPQLCSNVATSLPPQCGGLPIVGWKWSQATNARHVLGTTWGMYHLVGTYDGTSFTLTAPPSQFHASPAPLPDFTTPCPTPAGGWRTTDPARVRSIDDYKAFESAARSSPDFAGMWMDQKTPTQDVPAGFGIINVAFTANLDVHRRQLAALWGGPICVLQHSRPYADLERVRDELFGSKGRSLGLKMIDAGPNDVMDRVDAHVFVVTPEIQRAVDAAFGAGTVQIEGFLRPLR